MLHDIVFFILGLGLLIAGGNYVTDGAVALARRFNVSNMVIGLTVVAFGSSMPDLVVCMTSTLADKSELALGDVVGANIFDILLVVGVVALVHPVSLTRDMVGKDLPMLALASVALFVCGDDKLFDGDPADIINRTDGLLLLALFVIFMRNTLAEARCRTLSPSQPAPSVPSVAAAKPLRLLVACVFIAGGLAALVVGGDWLVDGASGIALKGG